jgi:hypothetical protein
VALRWLQRVEPESELSCRTFQDRELALFLGRGQQDEHECLVVQCVEARGEKLFHLPTNGQRVGQWIRPVSLAGGEHRGYLGQRQGISTGAVSQLSRNRWCQVTGCHLEQRRGFRRIKASNSSVGQAIPDRVAITVTLSDQQCDAVSAQPPGDEPNGFRAWLIEPLHVINKGEQRMPFCCFGEKGQCASRHQEAIGRRTRLETQSNLQRPGLRQWQYLRKVQYRTHQLINTGEWQIGLDHYANGPQDHHALGGSGVLEQRRLPHPDLASQHQHSTATRPHLGDHLVDHEGGQTVRRRGLCDGGHISADTGLIAELWRNFCQ